jgi:hypothetical protein
LPAELLPVDRDYLGRIVPLVRERLKLLSDSAQLTLYFFLDDLDYGSANLVQKGMDAAGAVTALQRAGHALLGVDAFVAA